MKSSNFNTLPETTKAIVSELLIQADEDKAGPDGYKHGKEALDEIEFESRDGFIAFNDNFGGLTLRNFCDVGSYFGGGYIPAHKKAAKELERQIDYSLKLAQEQFIDNHPEYKDKEVSYHSLYDSGETELAEEFSNLENDNMSDENSSIMHEFRFLYHGVQNGVHSASVSAALNTEGPYHRSSISWAKDIFCEGAKEVTIKWRTERSLKLKLNRTLKEVSKAIF